MERSSTLRWALLAVALFLLYTYGKPLLFGGSASDKQPLGPPDDTAAVLQNPPPEELCTLNGPRFQAELSSKGASLRHFRLTDSKYRETQDDTHDGSRAI